MAYEFTQDSFREFSEAVISAGGDQATLTTLLSQMQDVIIDNIGKMEQLTQNNENVTKENERLKSANMDLFLRIGSQAEAIENKAKETTKEEPVGVDDFLKSIYKEDNNNGN